MPSLLSTTVRWIHRRRSPLISLAVYFLLAIIVYWHTGLFGSGALPSPASGDSAQEVWFLSWPAYALTHGHNPFLTNAINYPAGADLSDSTAMPFLGLLGLPITLTLGPVATYNFLLIAALTTSAISMCLVLRRWTRWWPAAFLGGLLYGFSPYMIGEGVMHVYLTFVALPPLILLLLDEIVVRQRRNAIACGALLGLAAAVQFLISSEILAMIAIMAVIGIVALAITHLREVRARIRYALSATSAAAVVCGALLAYPIWFMFAGTDHIVGPPQPLITLAPFPGDLLGGILPTISQFFGFGHFQTIGTELSGSNFVENGLYLGIPLICVLAGLTIAFRRVQVLVFATGMAVASYVLALGATLTIDGHNTGIRLPFTVLRHLPLVQDILSLRFSLFVQLFAAMALAIGLDRLWWWTVDRRETSRGGLLVRRWPWTVGVAAMATFALIPLVPQIPLAAAATDVPAISVGQAPYQIPPGSVLLSYPYPIDPAIPAMLLQAVDGDGFKIVGGYAVVRSPSGSAQLSPTTLSPTYVESMFADAYNGTTLQAIKTDDQTTAWLRLFLRRYGIATVIVYRLGKEPGLVARYIARALGPPQVRTSQYQAWFGVPRLPHRRSDETHMVG